MAIVKPAARASGGGGKLSRSETVTVRLDPKVRYLAELAARKQRRTLSSFIEWAVEESLSDVILLEEDGDDRDSYRPAVSVARAADSLWDVDEADRFIRLATQFPALLTHEDQLLWKLVKENGYLWKGCFDALGVWTWSVQRDGSDLVIERLREHWELSTDAAHGKRNRRDLPGWQKHGPADPKAARVEAKPNVD